MCLALGRDIRIARDGLTAVVKESPWLPAPGNTVEPENALLCKNVEES